MAKQKAATSKKKTRGAVVEIRDLPMSRDALGRVHKKVLEAIQAELGDVEGQQDSCPYATCTYTTSYSTTVGG